jgi:branched-chain amino acid aminotransferase
MIWVRGEIVPEAELAINVADRTFEHGMGLFETFRTWNGQPTLLPRHLARLTRSAQALGLPLDPAALPSAASVVQLLRAENVAGDALLRITMTGGLSASGGAVVWMRAGPLPVPRLETAGVIAGLWRVNDDDPLVRHKCLNYWRRRLAYEQAHALGLDECLSMTADGVVWEGSRTNLFWVVGQSLETPRGDGPLLSGVMRALVLERAGRLGLQVVEGSWSWQRLREAAEVFLTNAVRGVVPVHRLFVLEEGTEPAGPTPRLAKEWPAPGARTARLETDLHHWLWSGGTLP